MRIGVFVFFYFEGFIFFFEDDRDDHVRVLVVVIRFILVGIILHIKIISAKMPVRFDVEFRNAFLEFPSDRSNKFPFLIYSWKFISAFVFHGKWRNSILLGNSKVICTECWRSMNHTGSVLSGNKISSNNFECFVGIV